MFSYRIAGYAWSLCTSKTQDVVGCTGCGAPCYGENYVICVGCGGATHRPCAKWSITAYYDYKCRWCTETD